MKAIDKAITKAGTATRLAELLTVKVYAKAQELAESYLKQRCAEQTL